MTSSQNITQHETRPQDVPGAGGTTVGDLVVVSDLHVEFTGRGTRTKVRAVDGVSFSVRKGEVLGLIGESGSGKSTVARALVGLVTPSAGTIEVQGRRTDQLRRREKRQALRSVQMIFQDPHDALDPRLSIERCVAEPLMVHGVSRTDALKRAQELIVSVGLRSDLRGRRSTELSGGQKQRVNIARALALDPEFLVCDEPTSALDVSVQAGVLNLLRDLRESRGLSMLLISHDLSVVSTVADQIGVMYLGKLVEYGPRDRVVATPAHPYTEGLLAAEPQLTPDPGRAKVLLEGDIPSVTQPPAGCRFNTRCPYVQPKCLAEEPPMRQVASGHLSACHFAERLELRGRSG